ncbi:MAG: hypothetical protein DRR16_27730 [Candidatus Parabeggiatoa sp. nov. 3]|nr:MAG: hypothetical protein DRR00_07980 [Gammaproteobacteria bacterium]RKZ66103.1 MAG: hypothetical protein DRQ99_10735 [Gammaproteobacteria bacterium]RKZ78417.1 MAG: hypothetical protein DRR16_27730 [Gammaproteobacteria bacterium]
MNKMRTVFIICIFIASIGKSVYAQDDSNSALKKGTFAYIVYAPTAKGGTIEGYEFDDTHYLGLGFGKINKPRSLGYYIDFKATPNIVNDSGNSDATYRYLIANAGVTFSLTDSLAVLGGIGFSIEDGSFMSSGDLYASEEKNYNINVNLGAMYNITQSFGVVVGYDTSSSAPSFGVSLSF